MPLETFKTDPSIDVHNDVSGKDVRNSKVPSPLNIVGKILKENDSRRFRKDVDKTGVLYMSHVPKGMKPGDLREMLSPFGGIGRIYLSPSDKASNTCAFSEGWIEFNKKKDALHAALLNTQPMPGKKFKDRLWTLKYLKSFKWADLSAQKTYDNAVKEQRGRAERSLARRQACDYLDRVERNRTNAKIQEKRAGKGKIDANPSDFKALKCRFKQRKPIEPGSTD